MAYDGPRIKESPAQQHYARQKKGNPCRFNKELIKKEHLKKVKEMWNVLFRK